ncbi:MAG: HNH endonuclease [Gemmataceae bacterium]|nr:HNH endonuclease [Gemmataceae bacterium]
MEQTSTGRKRLVQLWRSQHGQCSHCHEAIVSDERQWRVHYRTPRSQGGPRAWRNMELVHLPCPRQIYGDQRR